MKRLTSNLMQLFTVLALVLIFSASCKKDETKEPYLGTWSYNDTMTEDGITMQVKDIITLTKDKFTNMGQVKNPLTNEWIDAFGMKGELSVTGDKMNLIITEMGMTSYDSMTGMPTGTIIYYTEDDVEFDGLLDEMEMPQTVSSEFFIAGDKLTIKTDYNSDGDYTDEDETTVYTKQ